ncbi:hypothetical protein DFJ74DRAFT_693810 [Hyaloraphidium curvatum]|nr:hypothetical protein DFJ74DRAFT_693810 [Hyaloraphidium curvatum]
MSAVGDDPEKCFDIRNLRVRAYDLPGFYPRNPVRDEEATSIRKLLQRLSRLDLDSVRTLELRDDYAHDLDLEPTWSDMSDDDREHHAREHPDVEDHRSDLDLGPRSLAFTVDTRLPAVRELRLLGGREYPQLPLWIIEPGPPARVFANVEVLHLGPAWRIQGCHLAAGIPTVVRSLAELRELHVVLPEDSASAFRETAWDVLRPVCCILAPRLELVAVDAHPSEAELGDGEWLARRIHGVLGERRRNGLVVPERLSRFRYARQEFAVRPFFERPQSFAQ